MDRQRYMKTYRSAYKARAKIVKIAISNDLHGELVARAKAEGKTPTGLVRELVACGLAGDQRIPAAVADELRALERLVRTIANNINQLAHHANAVRRVIDVASVFGELKRLDAAVRAYTLKRLN
jgi:hypothetical protein